MSNYELRYIGWTNVAKNIVKFDERIFESLKTAIQAAEDFITNFEKEFLDDSYEFGHLEDADWMFGSPAFTQWIGDEDAQYPHYIIIHEIPIHEYEL